MPGIYLEDLCFDAQQAAEKAIKAVLIYKKTRFPYVHDLAELLSLVDPAGPAIPESVKQAVRLTRYAVVTRYPGIAEPVSRKEYEEAVSIAETVIRWAEGVVGAGG
jgi:HEPN domain-containing protein